MAKIQIKNSFITSSAQITVSSSLVRFSDNISAKSITGSFSGSIPALSSYFKQGGNSFGTTAILGTNDSQALTFEINNSERARIDTSGNVGIGTTNPANKLSVISGSTRIASSALAGALYLGNDTSNIYLQRDNSYDLSLVQNGDSNSALYLASAGNVYVNIDANNNDSDKAFIVQNNALKAGTELFRVSETGNVGIGTSSPAAFLNIVGNGTHTILRNTSATSYTTLRLYNDQNSSVRALEIDYSGASYSGALITSGPTGESACVTTTGAYPLAFGTNNTARMTILSDGNVGIGTSSPAYKLDVIGRISYNGAIGEGADATLSSIGTILLHGNSSTWTEQRFYTSGTAQITINSSGKVGIGTTNPLNKFDVIGATGTRINMGNSDDGLRGGKLEIISGSATARQFYVGTNSSIYNLVFGIDSIEKMRIDTGGNVGIGTTSVETKFDVDISNSTTSGVVYANSIKIENIDTTVGNLSSIMFSQAGDAASAIAGIHTGRTPGSRTSDLALYSYIQSSGGTVERIRILSNGNVGIGTSVPTKLLQVNGDSLIYANVAGAVNSNKLIFGSFANSSAAAVYAQTTTATSGDLVLAAALSSTITEYVRVKSSGNVGIGTTSPADKLHVIGNIRINGGDILNWGGQAFIQTIGANDMFFRPNSTLQMILTADGNIGIGQGFISPLAKLHVSSSTSAISAIFNGCVGIGTTSPVTKLEVVGSIRAGSFPVLVTNTGEAWFGRGSDRALGSYTLQFGGTSATSTYFEMVDRAWTKVIFAVSGEAPDNTFKINTSGNVGIGSGSPAYKLDVAGSAYAYNYFTLLTAATYGTSDTSAAMQVYGSTGSGGLTNTIKFVTGGSERVRIDSGGNVGIGTTNASAKLTLNGFFGFSGDFTKYIYMPDIYQGTGSIYMQAGYGSAVAGGAIRLYGHNATTYTGGDVEVGLSGKGNFLINSHIGGTRLVTVKVDGNVGIGTSSPTQKLEVAGYIMAGEGSYRTNIYGSNGGAWIGFGDTSSLNSLGRIGAYGSLFNINSVNGDTSFQYNGSEKMRITTGGNVGIGTTSPSQLVEAYKSDSGDVVYQITNPNAGASATAQFFASNGTTKTQFFHTGTSYVGTGVVNYTGLGGIYNVSTGISLLAAGASGIILFGTGTSNTERMRIAVDGNVGIGTSSPSGKLDILTSGANLTTYAYGWDLKVTTAGSWARSHRIYNTNYTAGTSFFGVLGGGSSIDYAYWTYGNPASIDATGYNTNNGIFLRSGGSVGIGTASPSGKLEIRTDASSNYIFSGSSTSVYTTTFTMDDTASYFGHDSSVRSLILRTNSTARLTVKGDGNVGIGTTSPAAKLDVTSATDTFSLINATNGAQGNRAALFMAARNVNGNVGNVSIEAISVNNQQNDMVFRTGATTMGGFGTERMRIDTTGNVGIGTTTPFGTAANRTVLSVNGTTDVSLNIGSGGSQRAYLYGVSTYAELGTIGSLPLTFAPNNSEKMRLNVDGNVGIGTTSPNSVLNVHGINPFVRINNTSTSDHGIKISYNNSDSHGLHLFYNANIATSYIDNTYPTSSGQVFGDIYFRQNVAGTMTTRMTIKADGGGNVGIGTTSPISKLNAYASGSNLSVLKIDGGNGTLFEVTDQLSGSLFSVNTIAGLPVMEAFSNNRVVMGKYNANDFVISGSRVGIGTNNPSGKLHVSGSNATSIIDGLSIGRGSGNIVSNTVVGNRALLSNTIGGNNSVFGYKALYTSTTGSRNSAFGSYSMYSNTAGSGSAAFGHDALRNNTTGNFNVAVGARALVGTTSGTNNTAVGYGAGTAVTTGTNLTILGYLAAASAVGATNEVTLGNSSVATLRCQVTTITALSDFRDKTDINNVEVGLSFVEKLRPVTFKWDKREWYTDGNRDGSKKDTITQTGFIAQELKALQEAENATYLNLVYESNPDKLEATPGNLMVPLIKAVQQLSAIVKQQQIEIDDLKSKVNK